MTKKLTELVYSFTPIHDSIQRKIAFYLWLRIKSDLELIAIVIDGVRAIEGELLREIK